MVAPRPGPRFPAGRRALAFSLALHLVFGLAWLLAPSPKSPGRLAPVDVSSRAEPDNVVWLAADDDPLPRTVPPGAPAGAEEASEITIPEPAPAGTAAPETISAAASPPPKSAGVTAPAPATGRAPGSSGFAGQGEGTGGTESGITFFQARARGRSVVYVIDRSMSMGPSGGLEAARREVLASLRRLPTPVRFQIIAYNRAAEPFPLGGRTGLVHATPANQREAAGRLEELRAEGGTDHLAALRRALALRPEVLFFLTDGDDLREDQVRGISRLNQGRTVIHALDLVGNVPDHDGRALLLLARLNGGTYQVVRLPSLP